MTTEGYAHPDETYEQFIQRASRIFPAVEVKNWTQIERAVFNNLMSQLIYLYSYGAITDAMLLESKRQMDEIAMRISEYGEA